MKNKLYLFAVAFSAIALLYGCGKDGAVGPEGPQGPQGNANVLGSNALVIDWAYNSTTNAYTDTIGAQDISQDIVNTGSVEVFYLNNSTEWWPLPDTYGSTVTTYGFGVGYVSLQSTTYDQTLPNPPSTLRIVIISSAERMAHPNVNWKNYEEAKAALKLKG
jgi:hypothetical protein